MNLWLNHKAEVFLRVLALFLSLLLIFITWSKYSSSKTAATQFNTGITSTGPAQQSQNKAMGTVMVLSPEEVSKHKKASDCWIVIRDTVYNATAYLNAHPGGEAIIAQFCGGDATLGFETKDGRGSHSGLAQSILSQLAIGKLGQTVNYDSAKFSPVTDINLKFSRGERENRRYEDD